MGRYFQDSKQLCGLSYILTIFGNILRRSLYILLDRVKILISSPKFMGSSMFLYMRRFFQKSLIKYIIMKICSIQFVLRQFSVHLATLAYFLFSQPGKFLILPMVSPGLYGIIASGYTSKFLTNFCNQEIALGSRIIHTLLII